MRQEGILNSAMMFTSKVTFGIGAFIAGLTIEFVGFDRVATIADVTPDMLSRLALYVGPGLSVIVLISAYIFSHYDIDAKRHGEIRDALNTRVLDLEPALE
jgi:Na+/melibiose symporter-like transporter